MKVALLEFLKWQINGKAPPTSVALGGAVMPSCLAPLSLVQHRHRHLRDES